MKKFPAMVLMLGVLLLTFSQARAQDFPWADFKPSTLKELIKINNDEDAEDAKRLNKLNNKPRMVFRGKILPSIVRVIYSGDSRAIRSEHKQFIEWWANSYFQDASYAAKYESELMFKEGGDEYWLPVQKQVIPYFEKELKKGEPVDLYLIRPGGEVVDSKPDWIFLVEEFQKTTEKK